MLKTEGLSKKFVRNILQEDDSKKSIFASTKKKKSATEEFYAVNKVSIEVGEGEILGILGPNGAGKTTLLRMLGTLMEPTEGSVVIKDHNGNILTDPVEMKKEIGYLSGNTKLYHRLSTREMLLMLGEIYGIEKDKCEDRIEEIFRVLDMETFADNRIEKLSTGQTQRASIARTLIHNPQIYIFDEPTLGLDIISADAIVNFMKEQKKHGKTVLYSTHYLEEAQFLCDKVVIIYNGVIIKEGVPRDIIDETKAENLREAFHKIMEGVENK